MHKVVLFDPANGDLLEMTAGRKLHFWQDKMEYRKEAKMKKKKSFQKAGGNNDDKIFKKEGTPVDTLLLRPICLVTLCLFIF